MKQYITPKEAAALFEQTRIGEYCGVLDIFAECDSRYKDSCLRLCAIYNAGRIAGIRQERAKRHKK